MTDPQVQEAQKDIQYSEKQIKDLETLDKSTYPKGLIDNLINFHKFRISNCKKGLQNFAKVSGQ